MCHCFKCLPLCADYLVAKVCSSWEGGDTPGDLWGYRWLSLDVDLLWTVPLALWIWLLHVNPSHPWVRLRAASSRRNGPRQVFLDACRKLYLNLTNPTCPRKTTQQIQQHNTYQDLHWMSNHCRIIVCHYAYLPEFRALLAVAGHLCTEIRRGGGHQGVDANNFDA